MRHVTFAIAVVAATYMQAGSAFAWGCIAVSDSGAAYGYSYSYNKRGDAEDKALDECSARTSETCEIQSCDED